MAHSFNVKDLRPEPQLAPCVSAERNVPNSLQGQCHKATGKVVVRGYTWFGSEALIED